MDLKYPIGHFQFQEEVTSTIVSAWINEVEDLPKLLRAAVEDLDQEQIDTPYRLGGWTVRQVIHHLADSHMNAYVRFKLAVTEETPVIKPYDETKWAELADYHLPIETSLLLLDTIHQRLTSLLRSLTKEDLERTFIHPDSGEVSVAKNIGIYAWHGKHHLAHITTLRERENW